MRMSGYKVAVYLVLFVVVVVMVLMSRRPVSKSTELSSTPQRGRLDDELTTCKHDSDFVLFKPLVDFVRKGLAWQGSRL